mgnify:CR=1 FL=1
MFRSAIYKETADSKVNLSPMIDMVFILLIFFIVTAVFVEENGFEVRTPENTKLISPDELPPMGIHIDLQNRIFIEKNLVSLKSVRPTVAQRVSVSPELNVFVRTAPMADAGLMVSVLDEVRLGGVDLISLSLDTD